MMTPTEITLFWDEKGLVPSDWLALCASLLCEEFSPMFTSPLQQEDSSFLLEVRFFAVLVLAPNLHLTRALKCDISTLTHSQLNGLG